jgi:hypothetical protein
VAPSSFHPTMESAMREPKDDLSRSLITLEQDRTLIGVVELSLKTWLALDVSL